MGLAEQSSELDLSPLDQIRQTEAEVARKIAAARKASEQIVEQARQQAAALKREAVESGRGEGQARCQTALSDAEEEARAFVAEAQDQADRLRRRGAERMQQAVRGALIFVIDLEEEEKEK
jgi:vacuolar-type H+-ATPase subunit H